MIGTIALLTAIMVVSFISVLLKYFHWRNTFPKQLWPINYGRNSKIWTVFPPIPLCNGLNFQYLYQHFFCDFFLGTFTLYVRFIVVRSTIVSCVFFILSCTTLQFVFVCSLFGLLFCSDTNTPRPCSTDVSGARHRFPPSVAPQEPMVALLFQIFHLAYVKKYYIIVTSHEPSWFNKPYPIKLTWANTSSLPLLRFKLLVHPPHYKYVLIPHKYLARGKLWLRFPHFIPTSQVRYQITVTKR